MKKVFLLIICCVMTASAFAQFNVYARMHGIHYGMPQKLVMETSGEVVKFDQEGRVTSYSMGPDEIKYIWKGNHISLIAYHEGQKIGEDYIDVTYNSEDRVELSMSNGTVTEYYRTNGSQNKTIISSNGQSMVEQCYYNSSSDMSPYKYTLSAQGQTETFNLYGYKYDYKGNWSQYTVENNGESMIVIRTITYY